MAPKSCAMTNERSAFGKRKPKGECLMTKLAFGVVERSDVVAPRYTQCQQCKLYVCVDCWEFVALEFEKLQGSGRRIMPHDVWHVVQARAFTGTLVGHCRGFEARAGGGGIWTHCCPLCVDLKFTPAPVPRPMTISGRTYGMEPPKLLAFRRLAVPWRVWLDDATLGPVLVHSVELHVFKQLVDDAQCQKHFRSATLPVPR